MNVLNEAKIEFLSRSVNESYARAAVAAFAVQLDPTLDELADIKTAVSEAVTNCIVHAYPEKLGRIVMTLRILEKNCLHITIKDFGCGIEDIRRAMQPCFTGGGGEERSGLGFTVMETFTDSLRVSSRPGKGTRVTMRKYIGKKDA